MADHGLFGFLAKKNLSQLNENMCESLGVNVRSRKEEREGVK